MAESLFPPHSRLFVACDRETSEAELVNEFQHYGLVQNINLCRDKTSGNSKGFAFIQFDKTSEAAAALEALNGKTIGSSNKPIKVTVALSKEQSGLSSSSDPSQFLRLFLVVPKSSTENELEDYFSQFGPVESVVIVKDRETKESKGYAYVKFKKFSDAANAYENCARKYKVVFAKPKEFSGWRNTDQNSSSMKVHSEPVIACTHLDDNPEGFTAIQAMVSVDLTDEQVEWLFDIPPGLEFVRFFNEPLHVPQYRQAMPQHKRKVMAQYDSPGTAAYALRKLYGFEFPKGEVIIAKPDFNYIDRTSSVKRTRAKVGQQSVDDLMQQVETLTRSLKEATQIIESAGIRAPLDKVAVQLDAFRCSAKLPPPQPLAPPNSDVQERLFLVCEPGLPPHDALWDVFGRFGNLIELYILNGKNCGYAKYASKASAHRAIQALNGQDLYRMRMKVMVAEPQREDRKRPRTHYD